MTRGNQRDIDRARAQARKPKTTNHDKDGLTVSQRIERDKKALEDKKARKEQEKDQTIKK